MLYINSRGHLCRTNRFAIILAVLLIGCQIAVRAQTLDSVHITGRHVTLFLGDTIAHVHPRGMGRPKYQIGQQYAPYYRHGRFAGYRRVRTEKNQ